MVNTCLRTLVRRYYAGYNFFNLANFGEIFGIFVQFCFVLTIFCNSMYFTYVFTATYGT